MFIKRYFDALSTDSAAPVEAPSLASVMARSGVFNSPGREGAIPSINTEKPEQTTPATQSSPAPATESAPAAKANQSSPSPAKEPAAASPQTAESVKVPTWQEVLKSQQPDAIFKELGYDERVINLSNRLRDKPEMAAFFDHWENKGDIKPYFDALNTDFQKMSPEDVMRHQLRAQNPELDAKQLDTLFKIKVTNRYKLDDQLYTEDEVAEGRIELMADAKPIRSSLADEQKKFLLPQAPEPKPAGPDPQVQRQQEIETYKSSVLDSPIIRDIQTNKRITIGEGPEAFNFPVDPTTITGILTDDNKFASGLFTKEVKPDGTETYLPNFRKQSILAAIIADETGFFTSLEKHYKSLGGKAAIDPIENAKPPVGGTPAKAEVTSSNPAAAAAKTGRFVRGGE